MIYNSAGHHNNDSGAVATHDKVLYKENVIAMAFRNGISKRITSKGYKVIEDKDSETLSQYLARIKPGSGSVICETHMNAFSKASATGIEIVIPTNYSKEEYRLASLIAVGLNKITGLTLRNGGTGVITEAKSKRGSLGIMKKEGTVVLIELGFISNPNDVKVILAKKDEICNFVGDCLIIAEDWLS